MKKAFIIIVLIAVLPSLGLAIEKPSSKETKKVMDYYNNGKGNGAVLVDAVFCTQMGKEEDTKNDCIQSFAGNDIKVGDDVYLWMNFMIPVDDMAEIIITYTRNDRIRKTQKVTLNSAFRYRTWKKIETGKPGKWTVQIFQEIGDEDVDLGVLSYMVKE